MNTDISTEVEQYHARHSGIKAERLNAEKQRRKAIKAAAKDAKRREKERRKGIEITIVAQEYIYWHDLIKGFASEFFDKEAEYWLNDQVLAIREVYYQYFNFVVVPNEISFTLKPSYCLSLYYLIRERRAEQKEYEQEFIFFFRRVFSQLDKFLTSLN